MVEPRRVLVASIDCTLDQPSATFFSFQTTTVVDSPIGKYREAAPTPSARFGYRFQIEHLGAPHELVVHYPDDKRRFTCVMDGTCYDMTTSMVTGFRFPLSSRMLELREIFWPRWKDCSVVFMTYSEGEPAAVSRVEVYELDGLPPASSAVVHSNDEPFTGRELGIQYEDPCGNTASEGAHSHAEWVEHVVSYAKYSGQNALIYPMAWYHGPMFPSTCEPSDQLDLVVADDRTQYSRWVTTPVDWYAGLLERCSAEGVSFYGALTLLRLGSLMQRMNTKRLAILRGAETINNMAWNNHVQSTTGDWTQIYNAANFNVIYRHMRAGKVIPGFHMPATHRSYVYGEHRSPGNHAGSIFNPVHPVVQEAILTFVKEVGDRYAKYPAFKGITFNMYGSSMLWWGSLHLGYDDHTTRLFEQETGIRVPVHAKSWDRFRKRYDYLTFACPEAWIAWRCGKVREMIRKVRDTIVGCRPDLQVILTLWDETNFPFVFGAIGAAQQYLARKDNATFFREAGVDIALYRNEPNISIDLGTGCTRDRGGHGSKPAGGVTLPAETTSMFRDFDMLDTNTHEAMRGLASPGAFAFNCWVESWGEHVWEKCNPGDPNLPSVEKMDGKPADAVVRINSLYPDDGFWWKSQLRIIPGLPAGDHFMEPFAHPLAEYDALRITRGGLFLDKAHTWQVRPFATVFTALPRQRFETVGDKTDPVAVRTLVHGGSRYVYAVNRDHYPVLVTIRCDEQPRAIQEIGSDVPVPMKKEWAITLEPYGLRAFTMDAGASIAGFTIEIPAGIVAGLQAAATKAQGVLDRARLQGVAVPGIDAMKGMIADALANQQYAKLRHLTTGFIVRKCQELLLAHS